MTEKEIQKAAGKPLTELHKKKMLLFAGAGALVGAVIAYPTKKKGALIGAALGAAYIAIDAQMKYKSRRKEIEDMLKKASENTDPNVAMPVGAPVRQDL